MRMELLCDGKEELRKRLQKTKENIYPLRLSGDAIGTVFMGILSIYDKNDRMGGLSAHDTEGRKYHHRIGYFSGETEDSEIKLVFDIPAERVCFSRFPGDADPDWEDVINAYNAIKMDRV